MSAQPGFTPWFASVWIRPCCIVGLTILAAGSAIAQPASISDDLKAKYEERTITSGDKQYGYRVLLPKGFAESSKKYPVVLFLHGAGERGDDNSLQLKHGAAEFARDDRMEAYPAIVIIPQCPTDKKWVDADWAPKSGLGTFPDSTSGSLSAAFKMVQSFIDSDRVDTSRIYVTGISMGGYGSWFAATSDMIPFAAALPICGGGDPSWADRYGNMPIWAFHGTDDSAVPVGRSREMIEALKKAGHTPEPKYTEYEGGGHDVWTETYKRDDVFEWLFSQHK